ncbi:MAG: hypothetical protein KF752_19895 [Pirellulaceae bacterium]|nr:hypothetical protein [Pirellulaceae bacterium]
MDANLRNSVDEVHRHIVDCANTIVNTLVQDHRLSAGTANELMLYASQLYKLLPDASRPSWLTTLLQQFQGEQLASNHNHNYSTEFASFLLSNMRHVEAPILSPDEANYDFDLVFDEVRDAQDIAATFDSLVAKLEQIIAADLIDSRVVQQALERLMALLKRNKHGSLTSILVSLHYGRFALKAFGGALAANKYLKPMVEAFKEEFAIAESKVQAAEATLKEEAIRRLTNEDRLMAYIEQSGGDTTVIAGYLGHDDSGADDAE